MPYLWPNGSRAIPRVTSEFAPQRKNPVTGVVQPHNGIDLVGFPDNLACEAGRVTVAGYSGSAGNLVRIRHDDGADTLYMHNAVLYVKVGDRVARGQAVGRMGTTGNSTGVHCHLETRPTPANPVNPRDFIAARLAPANLDIKEIPVATGDDVWNHRINGAWSATAAERLKGIDEKVPMPADLVRAVVDAVWTRRLNGQWSATHEERLRGIDEIVNGRLPSIEAKVDKLMTLLADIAAPKVTVTVDSAALKTALLDPQILRAIAGGVIDEQARRLKE